jgi:hypothetical protein
MGWLKEMEVISSVVHYLRRMKYKACSIESVYQHGPDIEATSPRQVEILIEAKGRTSSKRKSDRYGKEFNKSQKQDHLGRALLKCLEYQDRRHMAGITLPDNDYDRELVNGIRKSLKKLGIIVFFVSDRHRVTVEIGKLPD